MKWLEKLLVELEVPVALREQLLERIPAAYPNEEFYATARDTIHGILKATRTKNLIAPWCNIEELAAECAEYVRSNAGHVTGMPSRLRHTLLSAGDCTDWCLACSENRSRGLTADGTERA